MAYEEQPEQVAERLCSLRFSPRAKAANVARDLRRIADEMDRGEWDTASGWLLPPPNPGEEERGLVPSEYYELALTTR